MLSNKEQSQFYYWRNLYNILLMSCRVCIKCLKMCNSLICIDNFWFKHCKQSFPCHTWDMNLRHSCIEYIQDWWWHKFRICCESDVNKIHQYISRINPWVRIFSLYCIRNSWRHSGCISSTPLYFMSRGNKSSESWGNKFISKCIFGFICWEWSGGFGIDSTQFPACCTWCRRQADLSTTRSKWCSSSKFRHSRKAWCLR